MRQISLIVLSALLAMPVYAKHKSAPTKLALANVALTTDALKSADVILKTRALLTLGQSRCGPNAALSDNNLKLITVGSDAAAKAISADQFSALDSAAQASVGTTAKGEIFCLSVASNKKGMLNSILISAKNLGVTGDVLNPLTP